MAAGAVWALIEAATFLGPDDDVRRTVTGLTGPTFTYTTAMQAEDFPEGYPASAFVVYQISAQVGRGYAARFAFPDAPQLTMLGESIAEGQSGGSQSNFQANTVMAQRYAAIGGRMLSASAYLGGGSGDVQIGIYADDAGEPSVLLGASEIKAVASTSSGHWEVFGFAPTEQVDLIEGTSIWLAVHASGSINSRGSDGANQNDARRLISQAFANGLPDPFGVRQLVQQHPRHAHARLDQPVMTNNLDLAQVAPSQNNKETTINDQAGQLDAALTEVLTIEADDSNAYVLTASQLRRNFFIVVTEGSPAPTAAIAIQVPAIRRGLFKLLNLTAQTVTIEVAGQSEPAPQIAPGEKPDVVM